MTYNRLSLTPTELRTCAKIFHFFCWVFIYDMGTNNESLDNSPFMECSFDLFSIACIHKDIRILRKHLKFIDFNKNKFFYPRTH